MKDILKNWLFDKDATHSNIPSNLPLRLIKQRLDTWQKKQETEALECI